MSQEMAHGGVINDQMNTFDGEKLVSQLAVPIIVAVGVVASSDSCSPAGDAVRDNTYFGLCSR